MQHAFEGPPTSSKPRVLGFLSPRWSVLMPGDVECSKGGSRCHGQRNVGGDVLPVSLPDGVQGGIAGARANAGDADDGAYDC